MKKANPIYKGERKEKNLEINLIRNGGKQGRSSDTPDVQAVDVNNKKGAPC